MGLGQDNAVELIFLAFAVICLFVVICCWVFGERREGSTFSPSPFSLLSTFPFDLPPTTTTHKME